MTMPEPEYKAPAIKEADAPPLLISYDAELDILSLWNRTPAGFGDPVAEHLTVDSTEDRTPVGITLEHAAKLLRTYLFPVSLDSGEID